MKCCGMIELNDLYCKFTQVHEEYIQLYTEFFHSSIIGSCGPKLVYKLNL